MANRRMFSLDVVDTDRYGTVRFHNGLLLSIEVEYIRLLE